MKPQQALASRLKDRVRIERPVADESLDGAGSGSWQLVQDNVAAEVEDMLPSRGERLADGINVMSRPARVRLRHRTDLNSSMRFVMGERVMQIVAGPAELGRDGIEFVVEEYQPAGNPA
jgi:head-tail adaptor